MKILIIGMCLIFSLMVRAEEVGDYYFGEEKLNNAIMLRWIKSSGAGMVFAHAVREFESQFGRLNQDYRNAFERIHSDARRQMREADERRIEEERANEGNHGGGGEWRGHMDNRTLPSVGRAGMGC